MNQLDKQRIADLPTSVFQDLEEELMANIIRHCRDYGQPIATDEWLLKKLAEIGKLNRENIRIIARSTGLSQKAIERMLTEVAEKVLDEVEPALRQVSRAGLAGEAVAAEKSQNVQRVATAMRRQAKDVMNLCNTVMLYKARDAYKSFVQNMASTADEIAEKQEFIDVLNKHAASVVMGAESRQQALRKCIREFNERGIPAFVDKSGREWTPEAYINMAMRSTSNTMAAEIQMARADDYGIDLVEVDSHSGARPKCARDQGKIFDRKNKSDKYPHWSSSSYGQPDGLLGINCRHHICPYIEGVSVRQYFPTEDMEENDRLYKATQKQRALERDVRKQKRECMLYDQIRDREGFEAAAVKLKAKEAKLRSYVNQNPDLHRRKDREQVVGFDRRISAEAIGANKRQSNVKYNGVPKTWKRMEKKEMDSIKMVNPKFNNNFFDKSKEARQYRENCANCVIAYEMRKRGYCVTAGAYINKLKRNPENGWKEAVLYTAGENANSNMEEFLKKNGNQSRIQIKALWNGRGNEGHTFVAEMINGKIVFLDPQSGVKYNDNILDYMNSIEYWRIDDLEISDLGISACERE